LAVFDTFHITGKGQSHVRKNEYRMKETQAKHKDDALANLGETARSEKFD
jgi:hypothetical protein